MSTWFLICAMCFPRLTLIISYLSDNLPMNDTPFMVDVVMSLFFPRLLVAYWANALHAHYLWVVWFTVIGFCEFLVFVRNMMK